MPSCEACGEPFEFTHPSKRFCSERCQRNAANARYRRNRVETATCPYCGCAFRRSTTTQRKQVYCFPGCQYEARSADYQGRADIKANLKRAELGPPAKGGGQPAKSGDIS
jgi:hypothetical protein